MTFCVLLMQIIKIGDHISFGLVRVRIYSPDAVRDSSLVFGQGRNRRKYYKRNARIYRMLREVKPLDAQQWKNVQEDMANGPSEEQIRKMDEVGKRVQRMRQCWQKAKAAQR